MTFKAMWDLFDATEARLGIDGLSFVSLCSDESGRITFEFDGQDYELGFDCIAILGVILRGASSANELIACSLKAVA